MEQHARDQLAEELEVAGETPRWAFRVDPELKRDYLEACRVDSVSGAERIRTHMQNVVDEHKRARKGATEDE